MNSTNNTPAKLDYLPFLERQQALRAGAKARVAREEKARLKAEANPLTDAQREAIAARIARRRDR